KIEKREGITDNIELEVAEYLTKISAYNLTEADTRSIRHMHSMINDLERMGDLYCQISKSFEDMQTEDVELPEEALERVENMLNLIYDAIRHIRKCLRSEERRVGRESM